MSFYFPEALQQSFLKNHASIFTPRHKKYFHQQKTPNSGQALPRGVTNIFLNVKIKSAATPFNPLYKEYFERREQERIRRKTISNCERSARLKIIQSY